MTEYNLNKYDNDKLIYSNNDTKYDTYNNFDSYCYFI